MSSHWAIHLGHKRPSLPHRRWNWQTGRCLSQKCSSSKLQLVPGQRESDMDLEVDQGWHPWDLVKYKREHNSQVSNSEFPKRQLPTGSRIQVKCRLLRYISSQYHANIPVESIPHHTTQNEFKSKSNSPTSLTVNKNWNLEMRRMSMSRLQSLSTTWRQRHHEQPLGIPGHNRPSAPSSPMELRPNSMLVTEVFVFFKASASAWPKGKRLGSRSKLTSVRPHEIQRRQNSQFPTPSFQRTNPTGFRANVVYRDSFPANIMPIYQ